jgi:hypothetical protein
VRPRLLGRILGGAFTRPSAGAIASKPARAPPDTPFSGTRPGSAWPGATPSPRGRGAVARAPGATVNDVLSPVAGRSDVVPRRDRRHDGAGQLRPLDQPSAGSAAVRARLLSLLGVEALRPDRGDESGGWT